MGDATEQGAAILTVCRLDRRLWAARNAAAPACAAQDGEFRRPAGFKTKTDKCFRTDFRTDTFCERSLTQAIDFIGGTAGTRTQNQSLKRALLYQLSYRPICRRAS